MNKFYKKVVGKKEMIDQLSSLSSKLDTQAMLEHLKTAGPRRLYVVDNNGKVVSCDNFKKFTSIICMITGLELLPKISFNQGQVYHIFSKKDYWQEKEEVESPVEDKEEIIVEDKAVNEESDIEKYKSLLNLDDDSGSKKALHEAVKKDHGIEIKKNQKFEAMLEELASHLEK